jgi:MtN3 and saliva related transmembrane protein
MQLSQLTRENYGGTQAAPQKARCNSPEWIGSELSVKNRDKRFSERSACERSICDMEQALGWAATTLFTFCYIPQIIKTYRTKTVDGLSFGLLLISFIANIVALCYAILIKQRPLQIKYILGMVFLSGCIYMYLKVHFQKK